MAIFVTNDPLAQTEAMATVKGWDVVETYTDEGVSGTVPIEDRAAGGAMMRAVERGGVDALIVSAIDRLGRDTMIILTTVNRLADLNVEFVSCKEGIDTTTRSGRLMLTIFAGLAQNEKEAIVERLYEGRLAKVDSGQIIAHGGTLYGYRMVEDDDGTRYEVDPDSARIVKTIFELYTERRMSMRAIRDYLTKRRVPTPADYGRYSETHDMDRPHAEWRKSTIGRILRNEAYTGRWTYGRKWVDEPVTVEIPAIISKEAFERAERIRESNYNQPRNMQHEYLLAARVTCDECGTYVNSLSVTTGGRIYLYYRCGASRDPGEYGFKCQQSTSWRVDKTDRVVWEWITRLLTPSELDKLLEQEAEGVSTYIEALSRNLEDVERRIRERAEDMDRLVQRRLYGEQLTVEAFKREEERIAEGVARLRRKRQEIQDDLREEWYPSRTERERLMNLATTVHEKELTFEQKRRVVEELDLSAELVIKDDRRAVRVRTERPHAEELLFLP